MAEEIISDLLSLIKDLGLVRLLLEDLHHDLLGKVARFRQLDDLSGALGSGGTMLPGGEATYAAWSEARSSFIHGNYVATILLCQGLAEHVLAAELVIGIKPEKLPGKITFKDTLDRCLAKGLIDQKDFDDLRRPMSLCNPLSHYRDIDDPSNLSGRVLDSRLPAESHLFGDASFAIGMATRLLALPAFRLGD
nr:hypothetical protein [uncultured Rhodopila sp.]